MRTNQFDGDEVISNRIIDEVATVTGSNPLDLDVLHNVVDPDAINTLYNRGFTGSLVFEYSGCTVTVDGDGDVEVTPVHPHADGQTVELDDPVEGESVGLDDSADD